MGETAEARITCEGCKKSYAWKRELAGKRVKCKCGITIHIPKPPEPATEPEDMYDLAPSEEPAKPKKRLPIQTVPPGLATAAVPGIPGAALPYAAPVRDRMSNDTLMDMTRDVYAPVALLALGVILYLACFAFRFHLTSAGIVAVSVGLFIMTVVKAILLVGFAMVLANPLGVSFGGIWTATLKLAAVAVICDGATAWVDLAVNKMSGGTFGNGIMGYGVMSFPVALAIYWVLLIYLFSMDSGDSWQTVLLLSAFDLIVKMALIFFVLSMVLHLGGASAPGLGGGSAKMTTSELAERVDELQTRKLLPEARTYLKEPHNVSYMSGAIEELYAAGATKVYFEISRSLNGKPNADAIIIEMPEDKNKRQDVLKAANKVQFGANATTPTGPLPDDGDAYHEITLDMR
jgi:hypothetical protein